MGTERPVGKQPDRQGEIDGRNYLHERVINIKEKTWKSKS